MQRIRTPAVPIPTKNADTSRLLGPDATESKLRRGKSKPAAATSETSAEGDGTVDALNVLDTALGYFPASTALWLARVVLMKASPAFTSTAVANAARKAIRTAPSFAVFSVYLTLDNLASAERVAVWHDALLFCVDKYRYCLPSYPCCIRCARARGCNCAVLSVAERLCMVVHGRMIAHGFSTIAAIGGGCLIGKCTYPVTRLLSDVWFCETGWCSKSS